MTKENVEDTGLGLTKIEDGELLKWEKPGTKIAGILLSYRPQKTAMGEGNVYEIQTKDGTLATFAPMLLHKKLQNVAIGDIVQIEFTNITKTQSGTTLKHFEVASGRVTEARLKALGIEMLAKVEDDDTINKKIMEDM